MKKVFLFGLVLLLSFEIEAQIVNDFKIGMYGAEPETYMYDTLPSGCRVPVLDAIRYVGNSMKGYNTSVLNVLAEDGFNIVHAYHPSPWTSEEWMKRYILRCANSGMQLIVSLKDSYYSPRTDSTGFNTYNSLGNSFLPCAVPFSSKQSRVNLNDYMERIFTKSPYKDIIWGYYMADEPSSRHPFQFANHFNGNFNIDSEATYVEVPPTNVSQAMSYVKTKLAREGIYDKKIILCDANHVGRIHENTNLNPDCDNTVSNCKREYYNPQQYIKLLKRTDNRDVFMDDSYQTDWSVRASEKYEHLNNPGPKDIIHYLGPYKSLEYEQEYTKTAHKVISIQRPEFLHAKSHTPNANLLWFQAYNSIIHGATGIWFWGLVWITPDDGANASWRNDTLNNRFDRDTFPALYRNYVSHLSKELRFLVNKNILSTDPRTIVATKTESADPYGIIPHASHSMVGMRFPTTNISSVSFSEILYEEYYNFRYTIRTNGTETYLILTNPAPVSVAFMLDFNKVKLTNPFFRNLIGVEEMFVEKMADTPCIASTTYKTNRNSGINLQNGTVGATAVKMFNGARKEVPLFFQPLDVKVFRLIANKSTNNKLDLFIRDSKADNGSTPSIQAYPYLSPDIWIRNVDDELPKHENPEYDSNYPVYVNVRITNNSFQPSSDGDSVRVYWTLGGTVHDWDQTWTGVRKIEDQILGDSIPLGGCIGTIPIPILGAGQSVVVKVPWRIPDPMSFETALTQCDVQGAWHFCLLAKIESANDPSRNQGNTHDLTVLNNNVAWKNLNVFDVSPDRPTPVFNEWIYSSKKDPRTVRLVFREVISNTLSKESEILIRFNKELQYLILEKGENIIGLKDLGDGQWMVEPGAEEASVEIPLTTDDIYVAQVKFQFLTQMVSDPKTYEYLVYTEDAGKHQLLAGSKIEINRLQKDLFKANAGEDRAIYKGDSTVLSANSTNESVTYRWKDIQKDSVLYGQNITVNPLSSNTYSLSMLTNDGYIDYDTVNVWVKENYIHSIAPNPTLSDVTISYLIAKEAKKAVLDILNVSGISVAKYTLNLSENEKKIAVNEWNKGSYSCILIVDDRQVDLKTLIVQ